MNSNAPTIVRIMVLVAAVVIACVGCMFLMGTVAHHWFVSGPKLQAGTNWVAKPIGGPLEIRPLPTAVALRQDFSEWVQNSPGERVRLYELVIPAGAEQLNFDYRVVWGDTPLGQAPSTFVQFDYVDATNGLYRFHWGQPGKQQDKWLRIAGSPMRLLVQPIHLKVWPQPELQIVGIEGVEALGCFIADDGQYLLTTARDEESFRLLQINEE